ncbi:hypothetical protein [Massilia sp. LjRoot122]|uniref:hypothetical protein n=1 Tax=Massilia sp. LjRoot122 TaxID=3342257 RepID=UPI003ED0189A
MNISLRSKAFVPVLLAIMGGCASPPPVPVEERSTIAIDRAPAGPLPRPQGLLAANSSAMSFSETFLFDRDYRFQLRTLAGPQ